MLYNKIEREDIWEDVSRFIIKENQIPQLMTPQKFYTENKFGLLIDLRSMPSQEMHGSGTRLIDTTDGIQLVIKREVKDSGNLKCHVFVVADAQFIILNKYLKSVEY